MYMLMFVLLWHIYKYTLEIFLHANNFNEYFVRYLCLSVFYHKKGFFAIDKYC